MMIGAFIVSKYATSEDTKEHAFISGCLLGVIGFGLGAQLWWLSYWPNVQAIKYLVGHE